MAFVEVDLDLDQFVGPRLNGRSLNKKFDSCIATLAFGVCTMTDADKGVPVPPRKFSSARLIGSQFLQHLQLGDGFGHARLLRL
jgi:hypothetical protein